MEENGIKKQAVPQCRRADSRLLSAEQLPERSLLATRVACSSLKQPVSQGKIWCRSRKILFVWVPDDRLCSGRRTSSSTRLWPEHEPREHSRRPGTGPRDGADSEPPPPPPPPPPAALEMAAARKDSTHARTLARSPSAAISIWDRRAEELVAPAALQQRRGPRSRAASRSSSSSFQCF